MHSERYIIASSVPSKSINIAISPVILVEEIYPDHGPHTGGTFITITGKQFDENCVIVWDNVQQKTYIHTTRGTIHCFSPNGQHGWISTITVASVMNAYSNALFFKYDHILADYPFVPEQQDILADYLFVPEQQALPETY